MNFNLDYGLLSNIVAVAALMIANTIFRVALSVKIGDFDFDELKRGILKYLLTLIGVALFYVAGELCPQASVEISGEMVTIDTALNLVSLALVTTYTVKCFQNVKDIFGDTDMVLAARTQRSSRGK